MSAGEVAVRREPIDSEVAVALIAALDRELMAQYPEEGATHLRLDADEVTGDRGVFVVAYVAGRPVGCGAIRRLADGVVEVKRMFVDRAARGRGVGRSVLTALEDEARRMGANTIVLETGERQAAALALYERAGFARIDSFGEYVDSPLSLCMGKSL